jgi:ubiquinone biosynthesis protein
MARLVLLGLASRFRGGGSLARELRRARVLRRELERLGGVFVKVGQLLSLRTDQFPWEICREFANLLDRVVPFSGAVAERIVEEELQTPVAELFTAFERQPLAAASIGQVHVGWLRATGEKVAIKIRRPGIAEQVHIDLALATTFARVLDFINVFNSQRLTPVIVELRRIMDEELSYLEEARATDDIRRTLRGRPHIHAPRVHFDLTTDRVLTMEFIEGLPASALLRAIENDDAEALALFERLGVDRKKLARRFFRAVIQQIYEFDVCHIDPHPGNLILMPGNQICMIDFGSVGYFGPALRERMERVAHAMALNDVDGAVDATLASWEPLPLRDVAGFKAELKPILQRMMNNGASKHGDPNLKSNGRMLVESTRLAAKYGIQAPWDQLRFSRLMWGYDTIVVALAPDFNFAREFRLYVAARMRRKMRDNLSRERLGEFVFGMTDIVAGLPRDLKDLRYHAMNAFRRTDHLYMHSVSKASYVGKMAAEYALIALAVPLGWLLWRRVDGGQEVVDAWLADHLPIAAPWWLCALLLAHLLIRLQQVRVRFSDLD